MTGQKHNSKAVTVQLCSEKALCNVHAATDIKQNEVLSNYLFGACGATAWYCPHSLAANAAAP